MKALAARRVKPPEQGTQAARVDAERRRRHDRGIGAEVSASGLFAVHDLLTNADPYRGHHGPARAALSSGWPRHAICCKDALDTCRPRSRPTSTMWPTPTSCTHENAIRYVEFEYEEEERLLVIGADRQGRLLELVAVPADEPTRIIHADRLRPKFHEYLR